MDSLWNSKESVSFAGRPTASIARHSNVEPMDKKGHARRSAGILLLGLLLLSVIPLGQAQIPKARIDSPTVPQDVDVPNGFPGNQNPIAFFDDYSWRTFIALIWPAVTGQRGVADQTKSVGANGTRVFETYKVLWEVFHTDGSAPSSWEQLDSASANPCNTTPHWGDLTLASFSKFSDFGQAGVGTLVGPLVAQPDSNPSYIRYMTAFNKIEFEHILNPDSNSPPRPLYLRKNLDAASPVTFPNGSIDIKAAWMDMRAAAHRERYYTRSVFALNPETGKCEEITVGLVGLHIVQKTQSRPQWIWSTFEQVDNVPPVDVGGSGKFAFNDGSGSPMPARNKYSVSPLPLPTPKPFNVVRINPIHSSTQSTNRDYRNALKGTVWENYHLVMTQWPLIPNRPDLPGTPDQTFPGTSGATTAFANVTMETFDQAAVRSGCMNCHNFTKASSDFVWSLKDHSFPQTSPTLLLKDADFRALKSLLNEIQK